MSDNPQDKDLQGLRKILKASPTHMPPESFYRAVLARIEAKEAKKSWLSWSFSAKALASACLLLIAVWVSRETYTDRSKGLPFDQMEEAKPMMSKQKVSVRINEEMSKDVSDKNLQNAQKVSRMRKEPASPPASAAFAGKAAGTLKADEGEKAGNRPMALGLKENVSAKKGEMDAEREYADEVRIAGVSKAKSLNERDDVTYQARDIGGVAAQNSFDRPITNAPTKPALRAHQDMSGQFAYGGGGQTRAQNLLQPVLEWKGSSSQFLQPRTVVVRNQDAWQHLWNVHNGSLAFPVLAPDVDFNTSMVVGVYAGRKPTAGYSIEIIGIETVGDTLVVNYRETSPSPQAIVGEILTQPFHLKVIPQSTSKIQFKKR